MSDSMPGTVKPRELDPYWVARLKDLDNEVTKWKQIALDTAKERDSLHTQLACVLVNNGKLQTERDDAITEGRRIAREAMSSREIYLDDKLTAAHNKIAILESKASQFESTLLETVKERDGYLDAGVKVVAEVDTMRSQVLTAKRELTEERERSARLVELLERVKTNVQFWVMDPDDENGGWKYMKAIQSELKEFESNK